MTDLHYYLSDNTETHNCTFCHLPFADGQKRTLVLEKPVNEAEAVAWKQAAVEAQRDTDNECRVLVLHRPECVQHYKQQQDAQLTGQITIAERYRDPTVIHSDYVFVNHEPLADIARVYGTADYHIMPSSDNTDPAWVSYLQWYPDANSSSKVIWDRFFWSKRTFSTFFSLYEVCHMKIDLKKTGGRIADLSNNIETALQTLIAAANDKPWQSRHMQINSWLHPISRTQHEAEYHWVTLFRPEQEFLDRMYTKFHSEETGQLLWNELISSSTGHPDSFGIQINQFVNQCLVELNHLEKTMKVAANERNKFSITCGHIDCNLISEVKKPVSSETMRIRVNCQTEAKKTQLYQFYNDTKSQTIMPYVFEGYVEDPIPVVVADAQAAAHELESIHTLTPLNTHVWPLYHSVDASLF